MKRVRVGILDATPGVDSATRDLMACSPRHGIELVHLVPRQLVWTVGSVMSVQCGAETLDAGTFDALILWALADDAPYHNWQVHMLKALEAQGMLTINAVDSYCASSCKMTTNARLQKAGVRIPLSIVSSDFEVLKSFVGKHSPTVVKPLHGWGGKHIRRASATVDDLEVLSLLLDKYGVLMVQRLVPSPGYDTRVLVLGGRVLYAVNRHAAPGEWRTNVSLGGAVTASVPDSALEAVALAAAGAAGLTFAGIDLLRDEGGPIVLETNASPGWFRSGEVTGVPVSDLLLDYVRDSIRRRSS